MQPAEVVKTYLDEVWNQRRLTAVPDLISDPTIRHYPIGTKILTTAQSVERLDSFHRHHSDMKFEIALLLEEDDLVTIAWNGWLTPNEGDPYTQASIEIFRVRDSRIVEVWNAKEADGLWT